MLSSSDCELACSAALVLGRMRPVEPRTIRGLRRALAHGRPDTQSYILDAIAATGSDEVVADFIPFVEGRGSLVEQAVQVLRNFGPKALPLIQERHVGVTGWLTGAYIKVVAGIPRFESVRMLFDRLFDCTWEHARATSIFLRENHDRYPKRAREHLHRRVREILESWDEHGNDFATLTALKLVANFQLAVDITVLERFVEATMPPAVRRHGLMALEAQTLTAEEVHRCRDLIMGRLNSRDLTNDVGPALDVLTSWTDHPTALDDCLALLGNRHPVVVDFAVGELVAQFPDEALEPVTSKLESRHPQIRASAAQALSTWPAGRRRMVSVMLDSHHGKVRMELAERLSRQKEEMDPVTARRLRKLYFESCLDGRGFDGAILHLLGKIDRLPFNRSMLQRTRRLIAEERFADVIAVLQPLVRWRHAVEEARFLLAFANLRRAEGSRDGDSRPYQRCIDLLAPLARVRDYKLAARIQRAGNFTSEERLDIARSLGDRGDSERREAARILKQVEAKGLTPTKKRELKELGASFESDRS